MENACPAQHRLWGPSGRAQQGKGRKANSRATGSEGKGREQDTELKARESKESILEISGVRKQIQKEISSANLNHRP